MFIPMVPESWKVCPGYLTVNVRCLHQDRWDHIRFNWTTLSTLVSTTRISYPAPIHPHLNIHVNVCWNGTPHLHINVNTEQSCKFLLKYIIHCMNTFCMHCWFSNVALRVGWVFLIWSGPLHVCSPSLLPGESLWCVQLSAHCWPSHQPTYQDPLSNTSQPYLPTNLHISTCTYMYLST